MSHWKVVARMGVRACNGPLLSSRASIWLSVNCGGSNVWRYPDGLGSCDSSGCLRNYHSTKTLPKVSAPDQEEMARRLGHDFSDPALLREALTHPSMIEDEAPSQRVGYERLEFLGDRVLGAIIAEWLLERRPAEAEGSLTRRLSALTCAKAQAEVARRVLNLGEHLRMTHALEDRDQTLADACEAVIGALYLDGGMDAARRFVRLAWAPEIKQQGDEPPAHDPKTALQQWAHSRSLPLPQYIVVGHSGPDHQPEFEVRVSLMDHREAEARGLSKRAGEMAAAKKLLRLLSEE